MKPGRGKTFAIGLGGLACVAAVAMVVFGYPALKRYQHWQWLRDQVGKDFKEIGRARWDELLDDLLPRQSDEEDDYAREFFIPTKLLALKDDREQEVLVLVFLLTHPVSSSTSDRMAVGMVTYDHSGQIRSRDDFSPGRMDDVMSVARVTSPSGRDVIRIETNSSREFYVPTNDGIEFIRRETQGGKVVANIYAYPFPTIGPRHSERAAAEWRRMAIAGTWAEKLAALVWLGGVHYLEKEKKSYEEPEELVDIYRLVATDPKVRGAVADLRADPDPWISEAATAAEETLRSVRP